jgi:hypothetical protein
MTSLLIVLFFNQTIQVLVNVSILKDVCFHTL